MYTFLSTFQYVEQRMCSYCMQKSVINGFAPPLFAPHNKIMAFVVCMCVSLYISARNYSYQYACHAVI